MNRFVIQTGRPDPPGPPPELDMWWTRYREEKRHRYVPQEFRQSGWTWTTFWAALQCELLSQARDQAGGERRPSGTVRDFAWERDQRQLHRQAYEAKRAASSSP